MSSRHIYMLLVGLLALHLLFALVAWPTLPDRVPIHFRFDGTVTRWVRTDVVSWFGLWFLGAGSVWLGYGITRLTGRSPELWNVPNKKLFLALSPTSRAAVVETLQRLVAWTLFLTALCFAGVQIGIYLTATGRADGLNGAAQILTLAPLAAILAMALWASVSIGGRIRRMWEAEQHGAR